MKRLTEIRNRMAEIQEELRELETLEASDEGLTEADEERLAALTDEFDALDAERAPLQERAARLENIRNTELGERPGSTEPAVERTAPNFNRNEDPFDMSTLRYGAPVAEVRSRSLTAIERFHRDLLNDDQRQELTRKAEGGRGVDDERGVIPGLVLHLGNDAYQRAFHKALGGHENRWTDEERAAMQRADEFRTYMGLTEAQGGYGVPVTLDATLIVSGAGSANPFRRVARVETITNNEWRGLGAGAVTASFGDEAAVVGDNSPTFVGPTVPTQKAHAFVGASIEVAGDYIGLAADLQALFAEGKDDLEAVKFVSGAGAGSHEPVGFVTALDGTASEIAPGTPETFALADVFKLHGSLGPKYRTPSARQAWLSNVLTMNQIRTLAIAEDGGAQGVITDPTAGTPTQVIGQPWYEASAMDASTAINGSATEDNFVLAYGDWRNYLIADRVGMTVEFIPHLFDPNTGRPTGQRGWYCYWRVGADSINDDGLKVLSIPTTD